ncbi:MAG: DUF721 domain-containing protein [Bryobacterales bacterium]|jgi:predicted nucleic acid-binding Zn ribbon protein|nr:DUF721 domain-containing protein [Bryobacterales bacterium]
MESALNILNRSLALDEVEATVQRLQRCWKTAVGARIAEHSRVILLREDVVIVSVDDAVWQSQLHQMRALLLERLRATSGVEAIAKVEFRVSPARRKPKAEAGPLFQQDEADRIADPLLRKIYKSSRRKVQA